MILIMKNEFSRVWSIVVMAIIETVWNNIILL